MQLKAVRFGKDQHLVGFYRCQDEGPIPQQLVLFWNTGLWNRSGPHRLNTELAMKLTTEGFASFSFDLSGLGDSDRRQDSVGQHRVLDDIADACDYLSSTYGYKEFILCGICSSAIDAHHYALRDKRVVGLIMIDTYAYRIKQFYVHYYAQRVFSGKRWKNIFKKNDQDKYVDEVVPVDLFEGVYPELADAARDLQILVDRGVKLKVAFTGGFRHIYSYQNQFLDTFSGVDFKSNLTLSFYQEADHLFSVRTHRKKLFDELASWFASLKSMPTQETITLSQLIQNWEESIDPKALALEYGAETLTYSQLRQQVDCVIHSMQKLGIQPGDRVAIALPRSPDLIIAVIATVKMGACYVPIDLSYPAERIATVLHIAQPALVLCHKDRSAPFQGAKTLYLDSVDRSQAPPQGALARSAHDPVYIIFTSGSTGTPKGVVMGHGALGQLIQWQNQSYRRVTKTIQFSPISFDVSFQEIFATFSSGGALVLISEEERLDPRFLLKKIQDRQIERIFLPFVALQLLAEAATREKLFPSRLIEVFTAGEQLICTPEIKTLFEHIPDARLHNQYGPSETHVATAYTLPDKLSDWPDLPSIGCAIAGSACFILDEAQQPIKDDRIGELYLAGTCVGEGYWADPKRSQERFSSMSMDGQVWRVYRTGDLARWMGDQNIAFLGRSDDQVKIRGFRIELGEVEAAIKEHPHIAQAVVIAVGDQVKSLIAVIQLKEPAADWSDLAKRIDSKLPDYMRPQRYQVVTDIPRTPSGKIDRRELTQRVVHAPSKSATVQKSKAALGKILEAFSIILERDDLGLDPHFFESGGSSILAIKLAYRLEEEFKRSISVVRIFENPKASQLEEFLNADSESIAKSLPTPAETSTLSAGEPIAIIGMASRFPGAADLAEFWRMLTEGQEGIETFTLESLDPAVQDREKNNPQYVPRRGVLKEADCFDADFFNIRKAEAELIDPQQRVFLEAAYHTLEDADYLQRKHERIGIFAGSAHSSYYTKNVLRSAGAQTPHGSFVAMLANDKDYLATRVAYKLGLTGPALDIQTACSSSAVAIIQAVMSLRSGQCDAALAGGVAITVPIHSGYIANDGGMLSPSGHCRPFAKDADGTIFSDGVGLVLLKPLKTARRDGDRVYAVIRGIGISNDGSDKASFTAPSVRGQRAAIEAAWNNAGLEPKSASFLECHGTATALGDPIELEALKSVFAGSPQASIAIGSVKGNIGHTTAAAGIAGLIKTSLCLYHRQLVPTLHAIEANPLLEIEKTPFTIACDGQNLAKDSPLLTAGVSSFGVGGTNAHIVVSSGDQVAMILSKPRPYELLCLSSSQPDSLIRIQDQTAAWSATLVAEEHRALARAYLKSKPGQHNSYGILGQNKTVQWHTPSLKDKPKLLWAFPGQGTQQLGMGQGLAEQHPIFRKHWDRLAKIVQSLSGWNLTDVINDPSPDSRLHQTEYAQPAIFCCSLAMAYTLQELQLEPDAMIGHSIGEIAAACFAGLWSDEDACAIIVKRAQLMGQLAAGGMCAVAMRADELKAILHSDLDIAAINGTKSIVIAGPKEALEKQETEFTKQGLKFSRLQTSHAFHSRAMDPIVSTFKEYVTQFPRHSITKSIYSAKSGKLMTQEQAANPQYWADHLRDPVMFYEALQAFGQEGGPILALEIGSGSISSTLCKRGLPNLPLRSVPTLNQPDQEWFSFLRAIGELWIHGLTFDRLAALDLKQQTPLWIPGYPFTKKRYFIDIDDTKPMNIQTSQEPMLERSMAMSFQKDQRREAICKEVIAALEESSGLETLRDSLQTSFFDLGLDSLFLTQASLTVGERLGLRISFRQMSEDLSSVQAIVDYAVRELPADRFISTPSAAIAGETPASAQAVAPLPQAANFMTPVSTIAYTPTASSNYLEHLFNQQMEIMRMQMQVLTHPSQAIPSAAPVLPGIRTELAIPTPPVPPAATLSAQDQDAAPPKLAFGAIARISTDRLSAEEKQIATVRSFTEHYNNKTNKSKSFAAKHRTSMADPRVVTGFRPNFKELTYPVVTNRSSGPYVWDIDGHRYIDMLNGFGSNFFGHAPDFIKEILHKQVDAGYEIGPQFHLVGEASEMAAALTGHDRVAWCNTGSEAVLGCLRIARTVTGKKKVVSFLGSYHGINDEVIVRSNAKRKPYPAAPGIMPNSVENMLVLDYGTDESLAIIEREIENLAAVLVEPVQSRRPEFVPVEFWRRLRQITERAGVPLIFDEVITGFRYHPGGVQQAFGIQADLTSYGKVVGGGLPIGMIGGKKRFMDALDGGSWRFGDDSVPEVGVTYFAGTFVRHPLAIAAAYATLKQIQTTGGQLQKDTNARADRLGRELNAIFEQMAVPYHYCNFGSLMKLKTTDEKNPFAELLPCWLRNKGLHIWDGFPTFLTASHLDEHIDLIVKTFREALEEMVAGGLFPNAAVPAGSNLIKRDFSPSTSKNMEMTPPQQGARLGKTKDGQPAWFIEDPDRPGRYLQIAVAT